MAARTESKIHTSTEESTMSALEREQKLKMAEVDPFMQMGGGTVRGLVPQRAGESRADTIARLDRADRWAVRETGFASNKTKFKHERPDLTDELIQQKLARKPQTAGAETREHKGPGIVASFGIGLATAASLAPAQFLLQGPVERVRTVMQTQHVNPLVTGAKRAEWATVTTFVPGRSKPAVGQQNICKVEAYKNPFVCGRGLWSSQGALSLYRGTPLTIISNTLSSGLKLATFAAMRRSPREDSEHPPKDGGEEITKRPQSSSEKVEKALVALTAGAVSGLCCFPLETIRIRLAADMAPAAKDFQFTGVAACVRGTIVQQGWIKGLFNGLPAALIGSVFNRGLTLVVFDQLLQSRDHNSAAGNNSDSPGTKFAGTMAAAAVAQVTTITLAYPFSTVRTAMVVGEKASISLAATREMAGSIYKAHGIRGFYGGFSLKAAETVLTNSLVLSALTSIF